LLWQPQISPSLPYGAGSSQLSYLPPLMRLMRLISLINGMRVWRLKGEKRERRIYRPLKNACKRGALIL